MGISHRAYSRIVLLGLAAGIALCASEASASAQSADRGGFTFLVNTGVGLQQDSYLEDSGVGLAGANFGIGGFLTKKLALLGRFSATTAKYDGGIFGSYTQTSGVFGPTVQYWPSDRFSIEAGGGAGVWTGEGDSERGGGLILGTAVTLFNRGKHNLQVGVEYAPVFTSSATVHNIGITLGYQLF